MHPEIHGAVVGGAIGGLTVAIGVVGAEMLERARARRSAFETNLLRLGLLLPKVTTPASEKWSGPRPPKAGEWSEGYAQAHELLLTMWADSRGFGSAKKARTEVGRLLVRFTLLDEYLLNDRILSREEMLEVTTHDIFAVLRRGKQRTLDDDEVAYRRSKGLSDRITKT